nr:uncharacterized protein LOC127304019 [Lolium perenne]
MGGRWFLILPPQYVSSSRFFVRRPRGPDPPTPSLRNFRSFRFCPSARSTHPLYSPASSPLRRRCRPLPTSPNRPVPPSRRRCPLPHTPHHGALYLACVVCPALTNKSAAWRYYQGTKELPLPPELLLPTDGHGGGQVFQICSDGLGTEAVGGLSWSSVEAGENEEGAAVVAFSCMARLTASLPSSALTERRCHRSLASMRRPYFSAFSCKDVLLLDLLHREAVQDQREDDGVFARSSFKTVSSSSRLLLRWLRFDLALSEDAFTSSVKELVV